MPFTSKVSEIMSSNVFTVDIEDTVRRADAIMKEEHVKHIPVLEGTKLVGMISDKKILEYSLRQMYESDQNFGDDGFNKIVDYERIMDPITHVVYPEDSIAKAVKLLAKYKLECIAVVDWKMNLVGIVTHYDILLFVHNYLVDTDVVA